MNYDASHDTILIVEDEFLLRELATELFEDAGYRVFSADNADDAARFLREHDKVKVLFTDVTMPGSMSGTDLAQYVAKRRPRIGIVIVSGRPLAGKIPPGASFHSKPYETRSVLREVREMAARRGCEAHQTLRSFVKSRDESSNDLFMGNDRR